ncbi:MAG: response regulator [Devosia sp.]
MVEGAESPDTARVLLVDDDVDGTEQISQFLQSRGFTVDKAPDVPTARRLIAEQDYDFFVLDIVMPGTSGKVLCREIATHSDAAIIMASSLSDDAERISLLEIGADDYIVKPYNPLELLARIRAVMRRRHANPKGAARLSRFGPWELVEDERHLRHDDGRIVTLTSSEAEVIRHFAANPGVLLSREDLLAVARVRQHGGAGDRSIDALIRRLRTKVEENPSDPTLIQTVWGQGYVLRPG